MKTSYLVSKRFYNKIRNKENEEKTYYKKEEALQKFLGWSWLFGEAARILLKKKNSKGIKVLRRTNI